METGKGPFPLTVQGKNKFNTIIDHPTIFLRDREGVSFSGNIQCCG